MGKALRLLFNLHPGEGRKASLFIILGLLWSVGSYGSFALSEGMFLEHVGATGLPSVYFAIAIAMCCLSAVLIFALNRFSIRSLLVSIICLWIFTIFTFFLLHPILSAASAYWYIYKVVGWIIPISTYIIYWAFVDQYYDLQEGKRFFCLFNAVTFLGDALGGGLIGYGLDVFGTRSLLILFIGAMVASIPFIFLITQHHDPVLEEHHESTGSSSTLEIKTIIQTILRSKFTLYLLFFYFSMQLLVMVTEFNYMHSYEQAFEAAPENALTEFNGRMGMWVSLGNMIFGMLAYSRLVKKLGINNIIVIAPSIFLALYSFWFYKDVLALAIFGMVAREGLVYSFDDNNLNLLITGVPAKVKNQIRISIESFIEPIGIFAAATLLYLFPQKAKILGVFLSLSALMIVLFLRTSYPRAIFRNLVASSIRFDKKIKDYLSQFSKKELKRTEFDLLSHLKLNSEKEQLIAFECLLKIGSQRILSRLLNHVGKLSLPGKLKAIELLCDSPWAKESSVLERLERWRSIFPHPAIKSTIHFYLARHGILRPERVMHDLHSEHLGIRAAAILTFKTSAHAFQFPSFCALASEKLHILLESTQEKEVCLGLEIVGLEKNPANIERIFPFLETHSLIVNRAAGKALSYSANTECKHFSGRIIARLALMHDSEARIYCLQALEKIVDQHSVRPLILASQHFRPHELTYVERIAVNMSAHLLPQLSHLVSDPRLNDRCRLLAGKILGKINRKALQQRMFNLIKKEISRAYFYFYHAHSIQKQVPEYDLMILQKALLTGYHSIIDFIIQLLGIAGSLDESDILSHTLRSQNRKIRAQALESLEKACEARLYALLEPLIDERQTEEKMRHYLKNGGLPLNLTQLLDAMARSPSRADQIISLAMKAQLKTPDWRSHLHEKLQSNEEIFHHFALELLEGQHA